MKAIFHYKTDLKLFFNLFIQVINGNIEKKKH